jgi:hypothetical protein
MTPAGELDHDNGLTAHVRERLERIVIQILEIASKCEGDRALQHELMQVAEQISEILGE